MASSFQTHLKICAYKIVTCPNSNCDMKVERMLVDDHMTNVCQWRIIRCGYCNEEHYKCDKEVQWSYMYAPITVKSYGWSGRTGGNWTLSKNYFSSKYSPWGQNMVLGQIPVKYLQSEVHERQLTLTIKKLTLLI